MYDYLCINKHYSKSLTSLLNLWLMNNLVSKLEFEGSNWQQSSTHTLHSIHIGQWSMKQLSNQECIVFLASPIQLHFCMHTFFHLWDRLTKQDSYCSEVDIENFLSPSSDEPDIGTEHLVTQLLWRKHQISNLMALLKYLNFKCIYMFPME